MSIFGDIWNKVVGSSDADAATPQATSTDSSTTDTSASDANTSDITASASASSGQQPAAIDIESILSNLESQKGAESNWRTSIVDLLKLLDLESSLSARKELADELSIHEGAAGSAEENIALHRAVMQKFEENGGKVPDSLKGN